MSNTSVRDGRRGLGWKSGTVSSAVSYSGAELGDPPRGEKESSQSNDVDMEDEFQAHAFRTSLF